jgi:hypothetical protein
MSSSLPSMFSMESFSQSWCHRHRSRLAGRVPPQKRHSPSMRRRIRCHHHHRRHHCHRRSPVASSTSPWTPLAPTLRPCRHICACSSWKPLDSSIEWNLLIYEKCPHSGLYKVTGDHFEEVLVTVQWNTSFSNGHSSNGHWLCHHHLSLLWSIVVTSIWRQYSSVITDFT